MSDFIHRAQIEVLSAADDDHLRSRKLRAALAAAEGRATVAEADLAQARAVVSTSEKMIAALKLEIAILKRDKYGRSAARTARLIDQFEELETAAAEDAIRTEQAADGDASSHI